MNKKILILTVSIILILAIVIGIIFINKNKVNSQNLENNNKEKTEISLNTTRELPRLNTTVVDVNDSNALKYNTGLDSNEGIELVVVSEPMMSSQAYSLVLVKIKDGTDVERNV